MACRLVSWLRSFINSSSYQLMTRVFLIAASTASNAAKVVNRVCYWPLNIFVFAPHSDLYIGLSLACADAKLSGFNVDGTFSEYVVCIYHFVGLYRILMEMKSPGVLRSTRHSHSRRIPQHRCCLHSLCCMYPDSLRVISI